MTPSLFNNALVEFMPKENSTPPPPLKKNIEIEVQGEKSSGNGRKRRSSTLIEVHP